MVSYKKRKQNKIMNDKGQQMGHLDIATCDSPTECMDNPTFRVNSPTSLF